MSMRGLETAITNEAREILCNKKIRVKDMMEWSTSDIKQREDEIVVRLPIMGVWVAYKKDLDKRPTTTGV